jgi:Na+-transporting methylmalonyl-CoA/oxaloacetate decarboxylase gamma subunit
MGKRGLTIVVIVVLLFAAVAVVWSMSRANGEFRTREERSYSQLLNAAQAGDVKSSVLDSGRSQIDWSDRFGHVYLTYFDVDTTRIDTSTAMQLHMTVRPRSGSSYVLQAIPSLLFLGILAGFLFYIARQVRRYVNIRAAAASSPDQPKP